MDDRRVIEWEKDDIEELSFMKLDVLGLGMLGCMRRAFDLLDEHKGVRLDLASRRAPGGRSRRLRMIQKADTLGTFQIESRAQMSMLPRLKPTEFYDLVIQVAIVRPGPDPGRHGPSLSSPARGQGEARNIRPSAARGAGEDLGVPLFQEQAMKVAIVGAGFTPTEADALSRSMATFKSTGGVSKFHDKLVEGMIANGYTRDFAERTFKQIEGFGSYGFPESHAASFAKIAYASSWMKCHHPDIFCAALLNAQPMGFYAPAQIVRDAREHGVEVRPVCINAQPLGLYAWRKARARSRTLSISPVRARPAHGEGPRQRPCRPDPRRARWNAVRLGRGCLAAFGRAGRGAREARRCRRFPSLGLDRRQALVAGARPWRCAACPCSPPPTRATPSPRSR